ncbi:MAG: hypothetical protein M1818_007544 [Claussenomyces sp. TS43310]|nr:MAG: hypothetical protein M1818_007544 [Claussenomyces sp. TS43310]
MTSYFFLSWQLWEKLTFVLCCAILLVYCAGLCQLWWKTRKVEQLEVADEERRVKIEVMRRSGIFIQPRRNHGAPFGIRALESGVEVDGVWISRSNSPDSSDMEVNRLHHSAGSSILESPKTYKSDSGPMSLGFQPSIAIRNSTLDNDSIQSSSPSDLSYVRPGFKPIRSSHLRFSSIGESQLHGSALGIPQGIVTNSPVHSYQSQLNNITTRPLDLLHHNTDGAAISSNCSSQIERRLPGGQYTRPRSEPSGQTEPILSSFTHTHSNAPGEIQPARSQQYRKISATTLERIRYDSFANDEISSLQTSVVGMANICKPAASVDVDGELQQSLLNHTEPASSPTISLKPRNPHVNESVRKINPGFELLPAGTFGTTPVELSNQSVHGKSADRSRSDSTHMMWSKLFSRHRGSTAKRRALSSIERS